MTNGQEMSRIKKLRLPRNHHRFYRRSFILWHDSTGATVLADSGFSDYETYRAMEKDREEPFHVPAKRQEVVDSGKTDRGVYDRGNFKEISRGTRPGNYGPWPETRGAARRHDAERTGRTLRGHNRACYMFGRRDRSTRSFLMMRRTRTIPRPREFDTAYRFLFPSPRTGTLSGSGELRNPIMESKENLSVPLHFLPISII